MAESEHSSSSDTRVSDVFFVGGPMDAFRNSIHSSLSVHSGMYSVCCIDT